MKKRSMPTHPAPPSVAARQRGFQEISRDPSKINDWVVVVSRSVRRRISLHASQLGTPMYDEVVRKVFGYAWRDLVYCFLGQIEASADTYRFAAAAAHYWSDGLAYHSPEQEEFYFDMLFETFVTIFHYASFFGFPDRPFALWVDDDPDDLAVAPAADMLIAIMHDLDMISHESGDAEVKEDARVDPLDPAFKQLMGEEVLKYYRGQTRAMHIYRDKVEISKVGDERQLVILAEKRGPSGYD